MTKSFFKIFRPILIFLNFSSAFALVAGPAKVIGVIKSFDDKTILIHGEEANYEVPIEFVAQKNLKAGSKIEITLSQEQVEKIKIDKKKNPNK